MLSPFPEFPSFLVAYSPIFGARISLAWTNRQPERYYFNIMASERIQRRIERLLDQIDQAEAQGDWQSVHSLAQDVLEVDPENGEAAAYLRSAERRLGPAPQGADILRPSSDVNQPTSFADGRYQVQKFLGEGGKKKVYLAHDTTLDRELAFALIKTEGLDETSRTRIQREAQAMGRLGSHPHIVTVFDLGEEQDQPFMVTELMLRVSYSGLTYETKPICEGGSHEQRPSQPLRL